jgi:nucleoside-diphosphate kinase
MSTERTYVMLKPDAVRRNLVGSIVSRFENSGLKMDAMCHINVSSEQSGELYKEHNGKPFYQNLISYIHSGPVIATVWSGPSAVSIARKLIGATNPAEAAPGTIRGDFGLILDENVIHGSDSVKSAEREIPLFFPDLA